MNNTQTVLRPTKKSRVSLWTLVILLIIAAGLLIFRQDVTDWLRLRGYDPSAAVVNLAQADTMTPYATKVFYVNRPSIDSKAIFTTHCKNRAEKTIVLGCYHSGQNGIFILNVADSRLHGVQEVTAAHEMLHAAYDRLSAKEKKRIDALLKDFYNKQLKDDRIKATVDSYRQTEPNDLVNEMHSIFGTEVAGLPAELESYYARFFSNRQTVVNLAATYANEFTGRRAEVAAYDERLKTLKVQIDGLTADLQTRQQSLAQQRDNMNRAKNSGDIAAYNNQVAPYNAAVNAYNSELNKARQLIAQYNDIVEQRNKIALEVQELAKAINGDVVD